MGAGHITLWLSALNRTLRYERGRKAGTRATPPQKKVGGHVTLIAVLRGIPLFRRPHLSLREGLEQTPFPLALHRVGSVLAVKGSLRRFAPWTAPGRSERRAAYEGKKGGGSGRGVRGRVAKHDKGYYHSHIAAGTIDRFPPPDHRGNMWRHE